MDETNIISEQIINSDLIVPPNIINRNIDTSLLNMLKKKIEGKCISEGYVIKGSLKIVNRSKGIFDKYNNDGNFKYNIDYSVKICKPSKEDILICQVEDINKAGIVANKLFYKKIPINIKIIIPNDYYKFAKKDISTINIGDIIKCQVVNKRFKYNDDSIMVIARGLN